MARYRPPAALLAMHGSVVMATEDAMDRVANRACELMAQFPDATPDECVRVAWIEEALLQEPVDPKVRVQ